MSKKGQSHIITYLEESSSLNLEVCADIAVGDTISRRESGSPTPPLFCFRPKWKNLIKRVSPAYCRIFLMRHINRTARRSIPTNFYRNALPCFLRFRWMLYFLLQPTVFAWHAFRRRSRLYRERGVPVEPVWA